MKSTPHYIKKVAALDEYVLFIPGKQAAGSGAAVDQEADYDLAIGAATSDAAVWANAGFMTTADGIGGTSKGLTSSTLPAVDFKAKSVMLAMRVKGAASEANDTSAKKWASTGPATGAGLQFRLGGTIGNGKFRLAVYHNGTPVISADSSITLFDGNPHTLVVVTNASGWTAKAYVDGVLDSGIGTMDLTSLSSIAGSTGGLTIGHSALPTSDGNRAVQVSDVHYLMWSGALPSNIADLISRFHARPWEQLRKAG